LGVDRSVLRYRTCRGDDAAIRQRVRSLAGERRRFGYRRLGLLLAWEGVRLNHKKLRRLYREERLQVRRRGGRKRALGTRRPMLLPAAKNERWSLDELDATGKRRGYPTRVVSDNGTELTSTAILRWSQERHVA